MTTIFIDGESGTTGLRLRERIANRADLKLISLPADERRSPDARLEAMKAADVTVLCLPDDAAREGVKLADEAGTRVLDASSAHRTAPEWVYGMPELMNGRAAEIARASRVSVPGCHASGFILLVAPLVSAGIIAPDAFLSATSVTGYSGGGKKMIAEYESADRPAHSKLDAPKSYGLSLAHKHLPEMQKISGLANPPAFVPVVCDYYSGMQVLVPFQPVWGGAEKVAAGLAEYYRDAATIKVHALNEPLPENGLYSNAMAGTDRMELYSTVNAAGDQMMLVSLFDNLGKGSSGAAVQCMNLMLGFEETAGLE